MPSNRKCLANQISDLKLRELRRLQGLTQIELADRLKVSQPHVAQIENQTDMHLMTLRRYVEALGGELELVVSLSGKSIGIALSDIALKQK